MHNLIRFLLATSLTLAGCRSADKEFKEHLQANQCDAAMDTLPEKDPSVRFLGKTKQAMGTVASYAYVGLNYTVEVLWDVTGGTVMFVALCGPMVAAMALSSSGAGYYSPGSPICFPGKITALGAPPLGRKAHEATAEMRCPDLTGMSRSLRQVASCYSSAGGEDHIVKAKQVLESVQKSDQFYTCLPEAEKELIQKQLSTLNAAAATATRTPTAPAGPARVPSAHE